jgi:dCMP deaminase
MAAKKAPPRAVPSFDEYYMGLSYFIAARSKDPSTQVGAIVVDSENIPRGWGYNGTPKKMRDADINWQRPDKYPFVVHAEQNAFDHAAGEPSSLANGTIYITGMPCPDCCKRIINKKIKRIVYGHRGIAMMPKDQQDLVKEMCRLGNVILEQFKGNINWMRDVMVSLETQLPEAF